MNQCIERQDQWQAIKKFQVREKERDRTGRKQLKGFIMINR